MLGCELGAYVGMVQGWRSAADCVAPCKALTKRRTRCKKPEEDKTTKLGSEGM